MLTIEHLQSATQIITMGNISILTDPWLTDGEYLGSWFHYPPFPEDEIGKLAYDFIYVSHIHPDHLSEKTFSRLAKKPVIIHKYSSQFLKRKIESYGFEVIELEHAVPLNLINGAEITIFAADNCNPALCGKHFGCAKMQGNGGSAQIDTLAMFKYQGLTVLNTNDCPFELARHTIKHNKIDQLKIDTLLVGYCGAGPYPQCFEFETDRQKIEAAKKKKYQFLNAAVDYILLIKPSTFIPFAGTYVLGSRFTKLNKYRGVPNIDEAIKYIEKHIKYISNGIELNQFDSLDVKENKLQKYSKPHLDINSYINQISKLDLDYDHDEWCESDLPSLLAASHSRFKEKASEINFDTKTKIYIQTEKSLIEFGTNIKPKILNEFVDDEEHYVKITLDHKLLHRLLRGPRFAHWNNAEIGSHLKFRRNPDQFERGLYHCLCFFHQ